jgi:hypothetical protein
VVIEILWVIPVDDQSKIVVAVQEHAHAWQGDCLLSEPGDRPYLVVDELLLAVRRRTYQPEKQDRRIVDRCLNPQINDPVASSGKFATVQLKPRACLVAPA